MLAEEAKGRVAAVHRCRSGSACVSMLTWRWLRVPATSRRLGLGEDVGDLQAAAGVSVSSWYSRAVRIHSRHD